MKRAKSPSKAFESTCLAMRKALIECERVQHGRRRQSRNMLGHGTWCHSDTQQQVKDTFTTVEICPASHVTRHRGPRAGYAEHPQAIPHFSPWRGEAREVLNYTRAVYKDSTGSAHDARGKTMHASCQRPPRTSNCLASDAVARDQLSRPDMRMLGNAMSLSDCFSMILFESVGACIAEAGVKLAMVNWNRILTMGSSR